jgi:hypothetical protein
MSALALGGFAVSLCGKPPGFRRDKEKKEYFPCLLDKTPLNCPEYL